MLQSKLRKIAEMVPYHLRDVMSRLEDVTKTDQSQQERQLAYMQIMGPLDVATRDELTKVLQRVQAAIADDSSRVGNRKQRRLARKVRK